MAKISGTDNKLPPFDLDFSSSERFYASLMEQVFTRLRKRRGIRLSRMDDDRQREIITMHAEGKTLDEIGKIFGVTRERIRQIERKVWSQIALFKGQLKNLENVLVSLLKRSGGFDRVENLKEKLKEKFGWSEKEVDYLLDHYLGQLSSRFIFVDENYLVLSDHLCWRCVSFRKMVKEAVDVIEAKNGSLTIDEFANEVKGRLDLSKECQLCKSKITTLSPELFLWLFKNDAELKKSQDKMTVRRSSHFFGLNRSVLLVLKIAKKPLSKKEILDELKKMFPKKNFTLKQIQSTTSNSPQCFDEIFLWDRGGIHSETLYIHKDYIKIDLPILVTIEKILMTESESGRVPQIRLNRIFNRFADDCIAQGIPNVYALFSCLKVRACPGFSFQRSPYIGFSGNRQKISNAKILEDFVRRCNRPVSRQEMRDFGRTLGLQDEHISNTIVLTNLLATQNGYVIRNDAPEKTSEFQELLERIQKTLARKPSVSISVIFHNEKEICDRLQILDAKMLYSLLRRCADHPFDLKYPFISNPTKKRRTRSPRKHSESQTNAPSAPTTLFDSSIDV